MSAFRRLPRGSAALFAEPVLKEIAAAHGKQTGQVVLRFELQEGAIIFPKSTRPDRMESNMDIFDFTLSEEEMNAVRALDKGRGMHDPDAPGVAEMLLGAFDVHAAG